MIEEESETSHGAEVSAEFVENGAHVSNSPGRVVRQGIDEDGDAVWPVAFVGHGLIFALVFSESVLDGAFDVVLRHVLSLANGNYAAERGVHIWVGTAGFNGDGNLFSQSCKGFCHVAPTLQLCGLTIFKCSSHIGLFFPYFSRNL